MLTYTSSKQVLQSTAVKQHLPEGCKWWSNYIYHFSHITNIASILNDDLLKCRNQVHTEENNYVNDNASGEVMDGTFYEYKDYVRFYFRPLTPTQYHNEGIRAKNEITGLGAHCPVPVFLLFDPALLDEKDVYFSYESLASHYPVPKYQGVDNLIHAPFNYIYHYGSTYGLNGSQIIKHRHAEVVVKDECNLNFLQKIICRNQPEAATLRALLSPNAFAKYEDKIVVLGEDTFDTEDENTMFRPDFLKILSVEQRRKSFKIKFSKRNSYARNLEINWWNENDNHICNFINSNFKSLDTNLQGDYELNLFENLKSLDVVKVEIRLDGSLIYFNRYEFI